MRARIKKWVNRFLTARPSRTKRFVKMALYILKTIRTTPETYAYHIHQKMDVDSFLPKDQELLPTGVPMSDLLVPTDKKRVRIVYPSGTSWSCIGTLYEALLRDERYQVYVITENYPNYLRVMANKGCSFINLDNYDLREDKPDVLILTSYSYTDPRLRLADIHQYAGKVLALFPNVVINEADMEEHWRWVRNAYAVVNPDYYLFDCLPHKFSEGYIPAEKAVRMGCPIFDELYEKLQKTDEHPAYAKLKGKRTFLWATDHGLNETHPIEGLAIDVYIKDMFAYFSVHPECGLILRLHPYLKREILESGAFWTENDFRKLKEYCDNSPNIVWDEVPDYSYAFLASDAMLVDMNCGFLISYLCTGKPICRLMRDDMEVHSIHPEMMDVFSYAKCFADCERFIADVVSGIDEKADLRQHAFKESVLHFDGGNGQRVKDFVDSLLFET